MGNCLRRCFGVVDRRKKYTQYNTREQDFSIENYYMEDGFESLIDGETQENDTTRLLTDRERQLLRTKQFGVLVHEQGKIDAEIEETLAQHEKEIEREEAVFYEAKREAARVAKLDKDQENSSKNNSQGWANNEDWEIAGDEKDFENFLASVKARSLATRSQGTNDSDEAWSSGGSNTHTKEKTKGGFVEVKWDQVAGNVTGIPPQLRSVSAQISGNSWSKSAASDPEWDLDFVGAEFDE